MLTDVTAFAPATVANVGIGFDILGHTVEAVGDKVRLRRIDNGHSGFFWTRSDEPVVASRHPPMPPPGPDDWR